MKPSMNRFSNATTGKYGSIPMAVSRRRNRTPRRHGTKIFPGARHV